MTEALQFPFDDYDRWSTAENAFVAAHPDARFVVLRMDGPRELAVLLSDMLSWPQHPLLTPCQENNVPVEPVAVLDSYPAAIVFGSRLRFSRVSGCMQMCSLLLRKRITCRRRSLLKSCSGC